MALLTNLDTEQNLHKATPAKSIRLSTIHQAKGLEWKAVFVLWLVEGMFPAVRSLEEDATLAEERRLFYVAVTRAKNYLWLSVPRMRNARWRADDVRSVPIYRRIGPGPSSGGQGGGCCDALHALEGLLSRSRSRATAGVCFAGLPAVGNWRTMAA